MVTPRDPPGTPHALHTTAQKAMAGGAARGLVLGIAPRVSTQMTPNCTASPHKGKAHPLTWEGGRHRRSPPGATLPTSPRPKQGEHWERYPALGGLTPVRLGAPPLRQGDTSVPTTAPRSGPPRGFLSVLFADLAHNYIRLPKCSNTIRFANCTGFTSSQRN